MDDYNKHRSMVWPDPYLVPSLRDPRIKWTIHGLLRKARIHALSSATHGLLSVVCPQHTCIHTIFYCRLLTDDIY